MKRFYFPTYLFHGRGCSLKLSDFFDCHDRILLITDSTLCELSAVASIRAAIARSGAAVYLFTEVQPNPELSMIQAAAAVAREKTVTAVVSVGGGSVIDTGKAVAMLAPQVERADPFEILSDTSLMLPSLAHFAVPTTCGTGAEASSVAVISCDGIKRGLWSDRIFPTAAFVDADLLAGLPRPILAQTAMDALCHALESLIGLDQQSLLQALALEAARLILTSLQDAYSGNCDALERLCEAASLAGIAMGQSGTGMVHAMSDQLGEHFHVSHGLGNAVLLPYCLAYNATVAAWPLAQVADVVGLSQPKTSVREKAETLVEAIRSLADATGIPSAFDQICASDECILQMADAACVSFIMNNNPRPVSKMEAAVIFRTVIPNTVCRQEHGT